MNPAGEVRRADLDDLDALTAVAVDAYQQLAVAAWLVADPGNRRRVLHAYLGVYLLHALKLGHVWTIDNGPAVAVWWPRSAVPAPDDEDPQPWLDLACGRRYVSAFRTLTALVDAHRPTGPYQQLTIWAVATTRQRDGLGTQLLNHHRHHADPHGGPDYVTTGSVATRHVLLRHGFRDHGPAIDLPDGPRLWPMLRYRLPQAGGGTPAPPSPAT